MAKVFLAQPFYQTVYGMPPHFWYRACRRDGPNSFDIEPAGGSDLIANFCQLWADALNRRDGGGGYTHFAMVHADVSPYGGRHGPDEKPSIHWLDVMLEELDRADADLLGVVLPIKTDEGLTATAIYDPKQGWVRRLTQKELWRDGFPWTFDAEQAGFPGKQLLFNSGLWVARLDRPWADRVHFHVPSRIFKHPNGVRQAQTVSDDWHFSRRLHRLGARLVASKCISAGHWGPMEWRNDHAWGRLEIDVPTESTCSQAWGLEDEQPARPAEPDRRAVMGPEMDRLYAAVGKKQCHVEQLLQDNRALLSLLQMIKDGKIDSRQVVIDGDRVQLLPEALPEGVRRVGDLNAMPAPVGAAANGQ